MRMGEHEAEEEGEVAEWQRWERRVQRCSYKGTLSTFRIQGFLGNRTMICAFLNSPKQRGGPLSVLSHNCSSYRNLELHTEYSPTSLQCHQGSVISTV